jgi:dipeptidyl aminopeptidase/acylaminoacyl peptidase
MRPDDIESLSAVGRPAVAPDGSFAVFGVSHPDLAANRTVGQLWRIDLPSGRPRRVTRGVFDRAPQLRRDAAVVAFLRADERGRSQVFVAPSGGGEAVQATDADAGVDDFSWSPDGTRLAYAARVVEHGRYGSVEGVDAAAEPPRRVTAVRWHANGLGYLADRPSHVFVVDAPDPTDEPLYARAPGVDSQDAPAERAVAASARQITIGPESWSGTTWSADGREILVRPDVLETDARDLRDRLIAVEVDGDGRREVVAAEAGLSIDEVAVAGGAVHLLASEVGPQGRDFVAPGEALWRVDDGGVRRLTDAETVDLGEPGSTLVVTDDGVLVQRRTRGRVHLLRVRSDGTSETVVGGDVEVLGAGEGGGRVVVAVRTPESFGELALVDESGLRMLTDFGTALAASGLVRPREVEARSADGYPVHGWIATPEGEGPFPVLLQIHGGPYAQYGVGLFDETQVLVGAGYAVVYGNPRGSAGYGRAHGRAIRQAMGTVDLDDVLSLLEFALADDDRLDGARLGILGGSYGGYLTAWTIAHDHRFAGAIVERGMLDPATFQGTSDIGSFFGDEYVGIDPDAIARQSPMAVVDRVRTPTLVIHSELDYRCPLEQATRYYSALRRQGTPAELLIFPGEDHELSRAGQPRHRMQRFEAILDWWRRVLPTG